MLVLTRKVDEKILIGDDIVVTIVKLDSNRIRIGIDAPKNVHILRGELAEQLEAEAESIEFELSDRELPFAHPQPGLGQSKRTKKTAMSDAKPNVAAKLFASDVADNPAHPTPQLDADEPRRAPLSPFMAT